MVLITLLMYLMTLLILGCASLCIFLYYLDWKQCKYYTKRGVPYVKANLIRLFEIMTGRLSMFDAEKILYDEALQTRSPYVGLSDFSGHASYMITDLDLTRNIYIKDFDHFTDRRKFSAQKADILTSKMLISLRGEHWKGMRSKMSPTFTTGKIKRMFEIFQRSSQRMCEFLEKSGALYGKDINICGAYSKYAIDVIANCAFGIDSKTFDYEAGKTTEFEEMAARFQFKINFKIFLKFLIVAMSQPLAQLLGIQTFDVEAEKYFKTVIKGVLEHRRKTGQRHDDFLQFMLDAQQGLLNNEESSKEAVEVMTGTTERKTGDTLENNFTESSKSIKIDDDDIVANCVLFLIGGFDTTQSVLIFAAYQLALEQDCQAKLREEVNEAFEANNGKLTYEAVHGMSYLDMFINETLRYFPPAGRTERLCTKDYKIPIKNGPVIEKGSLVALPVQAMQRDPKYYENPEKFDPERFLPERKSKMHPYSFAAFGHGPRNCIGMRFALTEVKTMIATLVHKFKLEPCSKTDIPMKFAGLATLRPKNGMWLNIRRLTNE